MQNTEDPVIYLPPPDDFQPLAEQAIRAFNDRNFGMNSTSILDDLPPQCKEIVEKVKNLYQKDMPGLEKSTSHLAVFIQGFEAGEKIDTIILPLVNDGNAEVSAWNKGGREATIDWHWKNLMFISERTNFRVQEGKEVGGVVIQFPRKPNKS